MISFISRKDLHFLKDESKLRSEIFLIMVNLGPLKSATVLCKEIYILFLGSKDSLHDWIKFIFILVDWLWLFQ